MAKPLFNELEIAEIREEWKRLQRYRPEWSRQRIADEMGLKWGASSRTIQRIAYNETPTYSPKES